MSKPSGVRFDIHVSVATLLKLALVTLLAFIAIRLAPLLMILFMSGLLAVTLHPVLVWLQRKGAPRWVGVLLLVLTLSGSVALFFAVIVPSMAGQITAFAKDFPRIREQALHALPAGIFRNSASELARGEAIAEEGASGQSPWLKHAMSASQVVANGAFEVFVMLILAVYLVIDGPRAYQWIGAFFEPEHRRKLDTTADEVSKVVFAYVAGQLITSVLVFILSLVVLSVLHVPAALTLAVLAGIFDILPVLGLVLSGVPAVLLALTVSPTTGLLVLGFYLGYHGLESYLIAPKVYGEQLRLSTLAVLVSLLAGDLVAGIAGAISILPLVASYPIVERVWLTKYLRSSTIAQHSEEGVAPSPEPHAIS